MSNKQDVIDQLYKIIQQVNDVISSHESIRADDDQYDDPELWWAYPVRDCLLDAIDVVKDN